MANYFTDRVAQYPGRVTMTPTGQSDTYDMARAEGTVTTPGSPFNAETFNGAIDLYAEWYGTCSTAAGTSTKVVTCPGFKLVTGATIIVYFSNANTYTGTTYLNVNSTGAKQIYGVGEFGSGTRTRLDGAWESQQAVPFVYDGTTWRILGGNIITTDELTSLEEALGL